MINEELQASYDEARLVVDDMPGRWRHYKGDIVYVLGIVHLCEATRKPALIYVHNGIAWSRPLEEFLGDVEVDGKTVKRFARVES